MARNNIKNGKQSIYKLIDSELAALELETAQLELALWEEEQALVTGGVSKFLFLSITTFLAKEGIQTLLPQWIEKSFSISPSFGITAGALGAINNQIAHIGDTVGKNGYKWIFEATAPETLNDSLTELKKELSLIKDDYYRTTACSIGMTVLVGIMFLMYLILTDTEIKNKDGIILFNLAYVFLIMANNAKSFNHRAKKMDEQRKNNTMLAEQLKKLQGSLKQKTIALVYEIKMDGAGVSWFFFRPPEYKYKFNLLLNAKEFSIARKDFLSFFERFFSKNNVKFKRIGSVLAVRSDANFTLPVAEKLYNAFEVYLEKYQELDQDLNRLEILAAPLKGNYIFKNVWAQVDLNSEFLPDLNLCFEVLNSIYLEKLKDLISKEISDTKKISVSKEKLIIAQPQDMTSDQIKKINEQLELFTRLSACSDNFSSSNSNDKKANNPTPPDHKNILTYFRRWWLDYSGLFFSTRPQQKSEKPTEFLSKKISWFNGALMEDHPDLIKGEEENGKVSYFFFAEDILEKQWNEVKNQIFPEKCKKFIAEIKKTKRLNFRDSGKGTKPLNKDIPCIQNINGKDYNSKMTYEIKIDPAIEYNLYVYPYLDDSKQHTVYVIAKIAPAMHYHDDAKSMNVPDMVLNQKYEVKTPSFFEAKLTFEM